MRAYNKKRKPKHHIKPKWKTLSRCGYYYEYPYQIGMNMKQPRWGEYILKDKPLKIRYRIY